MSPKGLSKDAHRVYKYMLKVREASKDKIMKGSAISSDEDYWRVRNELIHARRVKGRKGRSGGLIVIPKKQFTRVGDSEVKLSDKANTLWNLIPKNGDWTKNNELKRKLRPRGFSTDDFWRYRKELLDKDLIEIGRGQGGRTRRADSQVKIFAKEIEAGSEIAASESKLWDPVAEWLLKNKKPDLEQEAFKHHKAHARVFVKNTASQHRVGKWSNPDVMLVSIVHYSVLKKKDWIIYSYEIKSSKYPYKLRDPANVFEAASHQKFAHYSYLVFETIEAGANEQPPEEISDALDRFGVGFAWFFKSRTDGYVMNIIKEAELQHPALGDVSYSLNEFKERLEGREKGAFDSAL